MKTLAPLDFLAPPPRPWAGIAGASFAGALALAAALSCWQLGETNRESQAELAQQAARLLPPAPRKLSEADRVRLAHAARVAGELRAPWADLLAAFEEHGRADIGLLKLEPDARAGTVRITGHARNAKALFAYLKELEADPRLERVALTTHQLERDTPGRPLRFAIQAGWRPGSSAASRNTS